MLIKVNGKELEVKVVKREAQPAQKSAPTVVVQKNDPVNLAVTANPLYGPFQDGPGYGTLSYPMRPEMYSAFQRPHTLARRLGVKESRIANDKVGIMTGATAASGSNPDTFCGDPPTPGNLKRCVQNYIFGKFFMKTNLNNIAEAGEYADYADFNKRLMNLAQSPNPFMPDEMQALDVSNRDGLLLANELWNIGVQFERATEIVLVRGNRTLAPAATQLGWFREFDGLERQIITGRVDVDTDTACPGADSEVVAWGTGIDATVGGRTFVEMLTDLVYSKKDLAERVGMAGTRFAFVMSSKLFRALTYVWACAYYTYRCQASATNLNYTDGQEIRRIQLDMFSGKYLLIDGEPVEVVFSDGIRSTKAGGNVWTDDNLFLLPIDWAGQQLLNIHYKKMDNADAMDFAEFVGSGQVRAINNGLFLVASRHNGFCWQHLFGAKMRLIQEAPFLAAVVNTIQYTYAAQWRDPYPGSTRHHDGGVSKYDGDYTV